MLHWPICRKNDASQENIKNDASQENIMFELFKMNENLGKIKFLNKHLRNFVFEL